MGHPGYEQAAPTGLTVTTIYCYQVGTRVGTRNNWRSIAGSHPRYDRFTKSSQSKKQ